MNSRLQQFLELENLTPARLADTLGIQRSGLSHILSGRNKPGYDFIFKLLTKFPAISAEWILTGKGKPYKEMNASSSPYGSQTSTGAFNKDSIQYSNQQYTNQSQPSIQSANQPLKDQPILSKSEEISGFENDFDTDTLFSSGNSTTEKTKKSSLSTNNQILEHEKSPSEMRENSITGTKPGIVRKERSIKRIIVFYSDGSFEELFPQK